MPDSIAFVGFLNDLHCGAHHGIYPRELIPPDAPCSASLYLNDCWERMIEDTKTRFQTRKGKHVLVLNGDLVDGKQRKSQGAGIYSAKMQDQVEGAVRLLREVVAYYDVVMRCDGTAYHEDFDGDLMRLDSELGIDRDHVKQVINLELDTGKLNVAHHPAGGAVLYQGTKMDRQILWSTIQAAIDKIPDVRWIVRAHLHEYAYFERKGKVAVQSPCWKLADAYAKKMDYERFQPDLGWVGMLRTDDHWSGYLVQPFLYPVPAKEKEIITL